MSPHVIRSGLTNFGIITLFRPGPWSFIRRILEWMVAISPELQQKKNQWECIKAFVFSQ